MPIIAHVLLALLIAVSAVHPSAAGPGDTPPALTLLQQPTPPPESKTPPRGALGIAFALLCTFSLSTAALVSSLAIKRRLNSISPDEKPN